MGLSTISAQPVSADVNIAPVLDNLHNSDAKLPNSTSGYPASEYTLTEVTPEDVNNLPLNVIKYYDPNTLDDEVHYYEIGFKNPVYGEGDISKYFKWAKDGESVKLVETSVESDAVLTIKYNAGDTINKYTTGDGQTIDSISEIYLGKDIKGIVGSIGKVGNISSKFVGNDTTIEGSDIGYTYSSIYTGIGGSIDSVTSSFIGNNVNINSAGNRVQGSIVKVLGDGRIGALDSEFVGNNVTVTSSGTVIHGGMVYVASNGVIENVTSDFIRNTTQTASNNGTNGAIFGSVLRTDGSTNITSSRFIENAGTSSANDYLYGGAIYNAGTSTNGLTVTDTIFVGNSLKSGSTVYGGAIYNAGKLVIENSIFKDNYVSGANAKAGAIFTTSDMSISASSGKTTEFSGNYTLNGSTKANQAIYVDNSNATLTLSATDGGKIVLKDKIDGASGYNVVLGGDSTGTIGLYNGILNANIRANGVNIDLSDGNFMNYDFLSLASEESAKYTIDVDFLSSNADKFVLGTESRGVIYLNDINMVGGAPTTSKVIQLITGPDTISIGLSQDLIDKYHKVTIRDYGESDDLTQSAKWGTTFGAHLYKDTIEEGLRTATSSGRTSADSLEYYVNKTTEDLGVVAAGDTMMLMNQSDKFIAKTFSASSSDATYTVGANLGATSGTFTVSGYNSSSKNILDANNHTMFEVGDGARVNLQYLTINNLSDVDGSLMTISQGGTGELYYVNVNGNADTAAILNDGSLTLRGGYSSNHNIFTGGGIKGSGTTTINGYWHISASGLQNTVNNGVLYLNSGTLGSTISGYGTTYINENSTITTSADNLRTNVFGKNSNGRTTGQILNLTGGEINSSIYSVTMNILGDVTVGDKGRIGNYNSSSYYYTDINIAEGAALTTDASKFNNSGSDYTKFTNEGDLNLTGGEFSYRNGSIYGNGTTNILGDVTIFNDYTSYYVYNKIHVKDGTLTISASSIKNNVINDSILKLTGGIIGQNILPELNGTGKTQIAGAVTAYYTDFNQDIEILSGGTLSTNWNRNFTNIQNDGSLVISNGDSTTDRTSSSSHGKWTQAVSGDGSISFKGYTYYFINNLYIDNEAPLDNKITIDSYANVWSNADLLGGDVTINGYGSSYWSSLYLTGGTLNHKVSGNSYAKLYIDTGANVISNALISSTSTEFLNLNSNSTLTISADNLAVNTSLASGSNLKLKSGTWDDGVTGSGTVTILSGEEVQHDKQTISAKVNIENGAKFTASASNLTGTVTNDGELYLSGLLSRKYNGTGTTFIDDTLTVRTSSAGFPATFDLNNGHLISDSIATYTFGHTTNNGGLTFNINASTDAHDLFNLASTSDAVFDIKDVIFGVYTSPTFANTVKTYQILKGSPSYLTLGETLQTDIDIYDQVRDQLGVNIYQDDPANRYFDDEYLDRITEGTVGATIELATTENNHDSVKITYGDYVAVSHGDRIDLLSDWNKLKTSNVRNFNFRTADDVYTSLADVGVTTAGTLNINGVSTTTTDADGNTIIKRSVIDLAGHSGFDMSSSTTKNVINLSNVEFRNGKNSSGSYGVFYTENDTFGTLLEDGTIQGGIVNCLFKDNSSSNSSSGGALKLGSGTTVHQILNSVFSGNSSSSSDTVGGALFLGSGTTVHQILNSVFSGNSSSASNSGGAIYNVGTISAIVNSTFEGNSSDSSYSSGAIRNNGTISAIVNSTFEGNSYSSYSSYSSGAISNSGTISAIMNSTFEGNSSKSYGGAIYNYGIISEIVNSTFEGNSSSYSGGAIYNQYTISAILNSTFEGNSSSSSSSSSGGAIYNKECTISEIVNSTFEDNSSSSGGAICNSSKGTISEILNSTFEGNSASYSYSSSGGAIYNSGTISAIVNSTFEGNSSKSYGGAIFNDGTISEIVNSTFEGNSSSNYSSSFSGAIYNRGTITISARDIVGEDGEIIKGITEFTGNYAGSALTDSNNYAIYNNAAVITMNAESNGIILMNDKIKNSSSSSNRAMLNLTGDSTGTIKLFDTVEGGDITADSVNINTANSKTQNYTFDNFTSDASAKWTIDVDFANTKADTFKVGDGTGTMYIDNLNVMSNTAKYTKVKVLNKTKDVVTVEETETATTGLALKDAVVDIRDSLSDTVYSDETFHQEAGYAVASSKQWNKSNTYLHDMISQCIEEDLDGLNLIASSDKNEVRNFVFRDGSTYTVSKDMDNMYAGTLNIKGVEGSTSTINADGHKLFKLSNTSDYILNLSDVKLTGVENLVTGSGKINISGKETILDGKVQGTTTLNSGNLRFNTDTFASSSSPLSINDGTLALNNGGTESYNIYKLTPGDKGKLSIDIDLTSKVSDKITLTNSTGTITVSNIDFINGIPESGEFVVQVLQNGSSSSLQLALDESIKHYVFDEYSKVMADEIQIDTDFGQEYCTRLYTGTAYGDLSLAKTQKINDSIAINIKSAWNDETEVVDSMGDTLYLVNSSDLSTRNFNSSKSNEVYNLSVDLDQTAQGNLNLNGTLDANGTRSTINFKNHDALQLGENTNLTINNVRLTGNRNLINVGSSSSNIILNNAYINGSILGDEKYTLRIDGNDTTTILGSITNSNVVFANGGLVIAENTFASDTVTLKVESDAYVYLNDGDISNYEFSNIDSSNSSKYGLDLDLENRTADNITAEGTGRIVFEKFDIVNRNLSNVDIGEDYTIRILHTSDDSLQLAISETVQAQLAKEYKLGTVHEILKMDAVVPVADWKTRWEVVEGDYDVYGKLKLATTVTTNDSLHLYELRKNLRDTTTDLGDTLMLLSILETDQDRRFYTETVDTYKLSVDIGEVTSGKMSLEGASAGDNLSVIDMDTHKGFKLSQKTEMSASDIEFVNAGYKDGSLFNLTNEEAVLNLNNVIITETTSTNAIENDGTVNFRGGANWLYSGITGAGATNISNSVVNVTEGLSITQAAINVNNQGTLNVSNNSQLFGELSVSSGGQVNLNNANALTSSASNDGEIAIKSGTLHQDILGEGHVSILDGSVINEAKIDQDVIVGTTNSDSRNGIFTTSADNIGGVIHNNGIVNLTGTLKNVITENGTTNVNQTLTLAQGAGVEGTLNLNDGKVSTSDGLISSYEIGTMLNEGTFAIDLDLSSKRSDLFDVGSSSNGLVKLETINFLNSQELKEGESFKVQVLETHGTDAIQIALDEALKADRVAVGTVSEKSDDLRAKVNFDEKFHDTGRLGTIYATLKEATTKTTNDSIELTYSGIEWGDAEITERQDTLKELAQYDTDEAKEFNFKTSTDKYTVAEDLGEATDGVLSINGVADENSKSAIDMDNHSGFELVNDTTLNLSDVEIGGAKDDKIIIATNPEAVINIENGTINGDISGTNTEINITGVETDTTVLNGTITDSSTTLDGGTLKFNTDTFADEADTLTVNSGRVDVQDDRVDTYDINELISSEEGRYSVDVDLSNDTADKFNLTETTSSGTVYIDEINYINGELPEEFKAQILETNGNDAIQIKLSDEIKNTIYDFGTTERSWDDLKADINFDEKFHDYTQIGDITGSIKEATTNTINDSIELVKNAPVWREEIDSKDRLDTLHEISVYDKAQDKTFNFKTSSDEYTSKADVGIVNNTLSVKGVADSENKSEINLSGFGGFELTNDTTLNLTDVEIGHAKNNTIISAIDSGSVINVENNTLNGNIKGNNTEINITGEETDTTVLNGTITDSDTTLDGGTLKFNTDTFADENDTLTVNSGRVDVQDSKVDTYDVTKLTSSETGKYSVDVDLDTETADKFNLTDTTSSGTVYIDDINFLNGGDPKEFIAQVLDTKGNNNIQIKLSDEIKSQTYDLDTTERNWNDLKADVNFDEKFHDYHQDGVVKGAITEATTSTTNDSIALEVTGVAWSKEESTTRKDTLHEISAYDEAQNKTFNFKTSNDEYISNADVGTVNGTLSVNGVSDSENKSEINLSGFGGFELTDDTVLNLTDVAINKAKNDNLIVAIQSDAVVNIENGTMNGNIKGNNTEINITGASSDTTILNGIITDSSTTLDGGTLKFNTDTFADKDDTLTVNSGRVDVQDSKVDTYDVTKLTSSETGKYSVDVDLDTETADKFNLTDTTSSGTVYIDDINFLNGGDPKEFIAQVLDTKGNNNIQIKLSDEIKNQTYNLGTTESNRNDLKADINFDEKFHDFHKDGILKGSIMEDTTATTNDSIALKVTETIWGEETSKERIDTLHEISSYDEAQNKTFNFKTSNDEYTSKADAGPVNNTLSINGVSDSENKSAINLSGFGGFVLTKDTILNLSDVEIGHAKDNTIITSSNSGAIVNIENNTLNGNIKGNNTKINITGVETDTTILNGTITDSSTTLDGGTLKFNTDTFADENDTLTVNSGRVDVQDSKVDTYDVTKLTSAEDGKYSIDIDLSAKTSDKFNLTDTNSSGTVYIDDIKYLNGDLPTEFIVQVLDTKGNNAIQIKLSDDIKNTIYEFGKTEKNWDDLKADVDYDEIFHDYHQEGELKGSIKEATTQTTNDSISLKMDAPIWGEIEITDRLDTLHEISVYNKAPDKTFNFKTSEDEYNSKANVGTVNGTLSINGVKDGENLSTINLQEFKGFELIKDSKLNITGTRISNGSDNTLITALDESAEVTLNNSQVDGIITGVQGYTVNITGDNKHIFDVHHDIQNANVNIDTVRVDMYNPNALKTSDIDMRSGILNLTADRQIADVSSNTFNIGGTFAIWADADLHNEVMDKLPSNTTISEGANLNVSGINLLSDTTKSSVAIPFAYKGFKDEVKYTGSSKLSNETQLTTVYAPIYKYDIRYDNREDMGYFVFSRHGAAGGSGSNSSDSYNPAVLASPVSTQAAGQSAMNEVFRYVFEHADAFTQLPSMERLAQIRSNQYALSTDFNQNLGTLASEFNNKAGWFRPYTTFETINLSNGPKVSAITYGSLVGFDTDFHRLKNGWTNVGTGYIGYNGSQLHYSGVDTTMNGGLVGLTETFYKGNFWTALTATAGAGVSETRAMYGKEDSTMLLAGIGSKTGYNIEFKEGKYILQPIMFMSYTFVNTLDYTNAAGLKINNDPMHTIQLNPSVRFVTNLSNGWQPYASVGMVWNLMNEARSTAAGVKLPEMHTKPYVEYGVGIQKRMKDKFTAFGQAMVRSGGRNGLALTLGFRWTLGRESTNEDSTKQHVKTPINNKTTKAPKTIIKQLSTTAAPNKKTTTLTQSGAIIKKI